MYLTGMEMNRIYHNLIVCYVKVWYSLELNSIEQDSTKLSIQNTMSCYGMKLKMIGQVLSKCDIF